MASTTVRCANAAAVAAAAIGMSGWVCTTSSKAPPAALLMHQCYSAALCSCCANAAWLPECVHDLVVQMLPWAMSSLHSNTGDITGMDMVCPHQ